MLKSYRISEPNEKAKALAEKVTELLVNSSVTYQEAEDALELAQVLLMEQTRPVRALAVNKGRLGGKEH